MMVYYEWIAKTPTRRQLRDAELVEIITAAREDKKKGRFVQTLGSRKLWIWLRGQGHDVARCTVERIMREQGWEGARYGSKHKTTIADDSHVRYPDLVDRRFYDRRHPPGHPRVATGRNRATSTGREGDNLAIHRAVDDGQPGDVLAINANGDTSRAVFGDILGDICVAKGIAGFVIDGATRDVDELTAMKLPVFAAAVTPAGPWKDGPGTTGYAVSCGHVVCHRCRTC